MPCMNDQHIARLEAQLERLVEGTFSQLFGKKIRAQDIAMQLARAMEDSAEGQNNGDSRMLAPDHYTIYLHSQVRSQLIERQPFLAQRLSEHIVELASNAGYRLINLPTVDILANDELSINAVIVKARHIQKKHSTTAVMQRVETPVSQPEDVPQNPQLLLRGTVPIPLTREVINIGRNRDNQIVVDDPAVSRHHLQLRIRFGRYMLFDTQSHGGTSVNDVPVKEHTLQNGDVICIGTTRLVYMEDHSINETQTGIYDSLPPDPAE
jgi:pSer/pThr/pTyr-binding forkhead associated (FHA) protein